MAEERQVVNARQYILVGGIWVPVSAANPLPVDTTPGVKTVTEVLTEAVIAAATTTVIADCADVDMSAGARSLAITVEMTYNGAATQGIVVHFRTSFDGTDFDTQDWYTWTPDFLAGGAYRQTIILETDPYILRALVENLDPAQTVTLVTLTSTLGA